MEVMQLMDPVAMVYSAAQIGAGIALCNGVMTAIGQGNVAVSAVTAVARQPECAKAIQTPMFLGFAMGETSGVYGLLIAIIMLFANPLVSEYMRFYTANMM